MPVGLHLHGFFGYSPQHCSVSSGPINVIMDLTVILFWSPQYFFLICRLPKAMQPNSNTWVYLKNKNKNKRAGKLVKLKTGRDKKVTTDEGLSLASLEYYLETRVTRSRVGEGASPSCHITLKVKSKSSTTFSYFSPLLLLLPCPPPPPCHVLPSYPPHHPLPLIVLPFLLVSFLLLNLPSPRSSSSIPIFPSTTSSTPPSSPLPHLLSYSS